MMRERKQCKRCPWKVSVDPRKIPRGYDACKHRALEGTIAEPGVYTHGPLRIMACHDTHSKPCVGWLANQIGPGNNIALRLAVIDGRYGKFKTVGKQHARFKDTLPCD